MRTILRVCTASLLASALLACCCATRPHPLAVGPGVELPADVTMNEDAGRGSHLYVTLRLESGEELPFLVDTGSPMTVLDKSLWPQLGECLGTETLWNFRDSYEASRYAAPKLYLGDTPLITDSNVLTSDLVAKMSSGAGRPIMGILGMDCLCHYGIQLDFRAGKMRFLDPAHVKPAKLGQAFPLTFSSKGNSYAEWIRPYIRHAGLVGGEDIDLLIDTGYDVDGALEPGLFRRELGEQKSRAKDTDGDHEPNQIRLPQCLWNGVAYKDLLVGNGADGAEGESGENSLGLRFLSRHLVTFDFPRRTMYLKQTRSDPLVDKELTAAGQAAARSTLKLVSKWMRNGRLPGWSKKDCGTGKAVYHFRRNPDRVTIDIWKKGDPSTYHYEFTRASKENPWTLQRAWRTDPDGHAMEEYLVP